MKLEFSALNQNSELTKYETIATYSEFDKDYILYTDGENDSNGNFKVLASLYKIVDGKISLMQIVEDSDKEIVRELIKELVLN